MARRYLLTLLFAILAFAHVPAQITQRLPRFQKHYVRERETPSSIASDFNIKTRDFLMLNNFPADVKLKPGQLVLIRQLKEGETAPKENAYIPNKAEEAPGKEKSEKHLTEPKKESTNTSTVDPSQLVGPNGAKYELTSGNFHVVQKGQTFYRIALIYHLTVDELKKINNMTTTDIKVGQEIKVSK